MARKRLFWQLMLPCCLISMAAMLAQGLYGAYVAAALMTVLLAVVGFWVSHRTLQPLAQIRAGAARLASGDLEHRLPLSGTEEFALLAECLNRMAEQLHARIRTILSQQNEREAMFASMEEGVLAVDCAGRILSLNETCARLLGREVTQLRGRLVHEVFRKADLLRFIDDVLASPAAVDDHLQFLGQQDRWLNAHGMALYDAEGRQTGALVVLHDVTRLRQLENIRRDFVANVSHELKTPITSIKGFVETLLDEKLEDKENALRFLNIILKQANRLDAIIRDLLSLSRIERGAENQAIPLEPGWLREVVQAAHEMCEKKAADKQIAVAIQCPDDLRANISAPLLEQVVVNLIDNAIKYSEPGSTVAVEAEAEAAEVVLRVRDQGCGIPAKHLGRLFERFYRVDKARSRELGGTGLGLAIVKHIVLAHHGTVGVESTVGKGSTFLVRLPAVSIASHDGKSESTLPYVSSG